MNRYSPKSSGVIQVRLAHLRLRKAALDELILSMERYSIYEVSRLRKPRFEPLGQMRTRRFAEAV